MATLRAAAPWRALDGFGGARRGAARVARPCTVQALAAALRDARAEGLSVALRGAGRSYGDAALNGGGLVLDMRGMNRTLAWDPDGGVATLEAGASIEDLWRLSLRDGWWPAVVPGTMFPTMGGCVAMNIHGKNCFKVGPFGDAVRELDLMTADGVVHTLSREREPELFGAVIGGAGLLGVVTRVVLQLKHVESGRLRVRPHRTRTLEEMFDHFEARITEADYLVGWIDAFARGPALGRGLVHEARYQTAAEDPAGQGYLDSARQDLPPSILGVPRGLVWRFMRLFTNDPGMQLVNALKYQLPERTGPDGTYLETHAAFAFLLDYVPEWRRAYDPGGFIQYQLFVPDPQARQAFGQALRTCQEHGIVSYLAVFKRHRPDAYLISHGLDGWSLALDFAVPARDPGRLWRLCRALTDIVLASGGRFYPAKDAVVDHAAFAQSLGDRLTRFIQIKHTVDPGHLFQSDQSRRLILPPA